MPSRPKFSNDVKSKVEEALQAELRNKDIAASKNVSPAYVTKVKHKLKLQNLGIDLNEVGIVRGRPRTIHTAGLEGLRDFLQDFPTARRDECCDFLKEEYDLDVSVWTVGRALATINQTYKKVTRVNARQDPDLATHFLARMAHYIAD